MTVVDFVRLTRANAALLFVMISLGLVVAFGYTSQQPVLYTATSQGYVVVSNNGASVGDVTSADALAQQRLATYAGLASSTRVAHDVIDKLRLQASPGDIAGRFSAVGAADRPVLTIFASAGSPGEARDLANAVIGALSSEASGLESAARPSGSSSTSLVRLIPVEQAVAPSAPSSPSYQRNLAIGALAGLVLGYLLALARRQLDRRIRTVDDIESMLGTSVLSIVPESEELGRRKTPGLIASVTGPAAESLRQLRTNLRFVDVDRPPRSIVITSANAGEGKSVVSANLARVLAAAGQPTILIDGDLRRPTVADVFDLDPAVGLTQVLAGDVALREVIQDSGTVNLSVIVAGRIPPNPSELLGSQRMQALIEDLVDKGYQVLIDAPPLLPVTDAGLLSGIVDGAMLVLAVGSTYKEQARLAAKVLSQVGGHLVGSVLNRAPLRGIGAVVYGYGYGYGHSGYYSGGYIDDDQRRWGLLGRPRRPRPQTVRPAEHAPGRRAAASSIRVGRPHVVRSDGPDQSTRPEVARPAAHDRRATAGRLRLSEASPPPGPAGPQSTGWCADSTSSEPYLAT